jgi:hypothetical protein
VLTYAMDQAYTSTRRTLLAEFRDSDEVRQLIARGRSEMDAVRLPSTSLRPGKPDTTNGQ